MAGCLGNTEIEWKKTYLDEIDGEGAWVNVEFSHGLDVKVIVSRDDELSVYEFQWDEPSKYPELTEQAVEEFDPYYYVNNDFESWANK